MHREAVNDDIDRVLLLLAQDGSLVEAVHDPIDPDARVPLRQQLPEELAVLPLALADDRGKDLEPSSLGQLQHLVDDLLWRLARYLVLTDRAVRSTDARVQQAQVVVDLSDRAHRRTRIARGGLLINGDGR